MSKVCRAECRAWKGNHSTRSFQHKLTTKHYVMSCDWPGSVTPMSCWAASRHQRSRRASTPLWKSHIDAVRTSMSKWNQIHYFFSSVVIHRTFPLFGLRMVEVKQTKVSVLISKCWSDLWPCSFWSPWCCGAPSRSELSTCSLQHVVALRMCLLFYTAQSRPPSVRLKQQQDKRSDALWESEACGRMLRCAGR